MFAVNNQGLRSRVICRLSTYDVTPPTGRFEAEFDTTSNPEILKASVVVHDDSPITETYVGIGYRSWIYGDQVKRFTPTDVNKRWAPYIDTGKCKFKKQCFCLQKNLEKYHAWSCHNVQEVFHVYLNKFENAFTHLFLVLLGNY